MNSDYKNPTPLVLPAPIGLDVEITAVQVALTAGLTWLQKSFGRAHLIPIKDQEDNQILVPHAYLGSKKYTSVLPNDSFRAYSFFRIAGAQENINDYDSNRYSYLWQTNIDIIFWFNLKEVDKFLRPGGPVDDTIFTEDLKHRILVVLQKQSEISEIIRIWDEKPEDIFSGYTLNQQQRDLLMFPYAGLRFETVLAYQQKVVC